VEAKQLIGDDHIQGWRRVELCKNAELRLG